MIESTEQKGLGLQLRQLMYECTLHNQPRSVRHIMCVTS